MSLATLKKSSGQFDKLQAELEKINSPASTSSFADDRFWKPELDKTGNGYAVIRFLPQPEGEELPWVRIWSHAFSGPGGWYIENSLTTLNKKDPVAEYNTELWNSGNDADKDTARKQKRVLKYYSNIYVVNDPKHPENQGKVFLFRFGKKIFDKLTEAMNPACDDEIALNPFDLWKGADFKLKIRKVDGFWNYDKSEFEAPSALLDDDAALEKLWETQYPLAEFTASTNFKSYEELSTRLATVLSGGLGDPVSHNVVDMKTPFDEPVETLVVDTKEVPAPTVEGIEEDTMSYFEKLAGDK